MLQTLPQEVIAPASSLDETRPRVASVAPVAEEMRERLLPHAASVGDDDEFHPAWGSCYVPGPNPEPLSEEHLLKRLYVLDSWLDGFNAESGVATAYRRAVWTALNNLVGKAHSILRHDRQQAFGAEYALHSMVDWYRFDRHPNAGIQELGATLQSALDALRKLLNEAPPAPSMEHRQPDWRRQPEMATRYL